MTTTNLLLMVIFIVSAIVSIANFMDYDVQLRESGDATKKQIGTIIGGLDLPAKIVCFAVIIYFLAFSGLCDGLFDWFM